MSESSLESLLKIFEFEKKARLRSYCKTLRVSSTDFAALILSCDTSSIPFSHKMSVREFVPAHLNPSESEEQALGDNPPGDLSPEAEKWVSKISQAFVERQYRVGHIFYTPDLSKWHFFCFDLNDLDAENQWKEGSHVHFLNWLWTGQTADSVWSKFVKENERPGAVIHLRFSFEQ